MRSFGTLFTALALALGASVFQSTTHAGDKPGDQLAHMVYFKLKDNSAEAKKKLVDSCYKHLKGHDGEVYFSAGVVAADLKREVNDRDWDVALHIVFKDLAAHDKYQVHPRHNDFIKEGNENWAKVRVFDSYIAPR